MSRFNSFDPMTPAQSKALGSALAEGVLQVHHQGMVYWEQQLRLVLNDRPRWIPQKVFAWMAAKVLKQAVLMGEVPKPLTVAIEVRGKK